MTPPSPNKTSGLAITSLVCGILGPFTLALSSIAGIITGHMGLSQIKHSDKPLKGRSLAITGLIISYLTIIAIPVAAFSVVTILTRVSNDAQIAHVQGDFATLEAALKMYRITTGSYPEDAHGLNALVSPPSNLPDPKRWTKIMDQVPVDPWGNAYSYRLQQDQEPLITCFGPDGIADTSDDLVSN